MPSHCIPTIRMDFAVIAAMASPPLRPVGTRRRASPQPSARAGGRGRVDDPRGRRRARAPRAAVQRRQGLGRAARAGREGVRAAADAVPGAARRHRPQLPRGDRLPRPPPAAGRAQADRRLGPGVDRRRARDRGLPRRVAQPAADDHPARRAGGRYASTPRSVAPAATRSARGPRSGCSPSATSSASGIPRAQRAEPWALYNARIRPGENIRVFPLSNWTELDVWRYIASEGLDLPSIYFAHQRRVIERDGILLAESEWVSRARRRERPRDHGPLSHGR